MINAILKSTPMNCLSSKVAAVNGFRKAYMHKYVMNTAKEALIKKFSLIIPELSLDIFNSFFNAIN
jgi:hypothetical protein